MAAQAEDESGRKAKIILGIACPGRGIGETGHQVFRLNGADGDMASQANIESAPGRHGEGSLRRQGRTRRTGASGEGHFPGMCRAKQDLGKGSDPTVVAKREARTKEVGEGGAAGVYHAGRVCSWAGKSQLGVVIAAKVGSDSEVTA